MCDIEPDVVREVVAENKSLRQQLTEVQEEVAKQKNRNIELESKLYDIARKGWTSVLADRQVEKERAEKAESERDALLVSSQHCECLSTGEGIREQLEQAEQENKRLREALEAVREHYHTDCCNCKYKAMLAEQALKKEVE